ncbi:Fur family transcriptional regulator [Natranaerofaba carboxydovora]|uniref:Fur family transcriptional regulator n=1 Tax=Natranaerofaba carboxydovora TaxID=2742683 RepID=UPI001F1306FB|nr:Fur family transcriptional regulator [Natranaerofaba carboxydovora]UMZ75122.1 Ferric uptake regulation protein [Natranaerofaba carboxydovora]
MNKKDQSEKINAYKDKFKDYKLTPQRKRILGIFLENEDAHLSAEEVFKLIQDKKEDIGLATVYRTLDLLDELGVLHKLNFGDGRSRFELNKSEKSHHHHHLICVKCHKIIEVKDDLLQKLEATIEDEHSFEILDHRVKFYGYCPECND